MTLSVKVLKMNTRPISLGNGSHSSDMDRFRGLGCSGKMLKTIISVLFWSSRETCVGAKWAASLRKHASIRPLSLIRPKTKALAVMVTRGNHSSQSIRSPRSQTAASRVALLKLTTEGAPLWHSRVAQVDLTVKTGSTIRPARISSITKAL